MKSCLAYSVLIFSVEKPGHNRVRSGATTELASVAGPLSANSSGPPPRPWAPNPSPPESKQLADLLMPRSGVGNILVNPPAAQYQLDFKQSYSVQPQETHQKGLSEDEDDVPLQGGKFENLVLNDTLQLRHQRKPAPTLPPNAIIYEPPPPPTRSARNRRDPTPELGFTVTRATGNTATAMERDRPASSRTVAQPPTQATANTNANATTAGTRPKQRFAASQTVHVPTQQQIQTQVHQQRLTKSAGKRRVDERDYGVNPGSEERRPANQRGGLRSDEERDSGVGVAEPAYPVPSRSLAFLQGGGGGGGGYPDQRPPQQQQQHQPQRYPEGHLYEQNEGVPVHAMRASHPQPTPLTTNGNPYFGAANDGEYVDQGLDSSPVEPLPQAPSIVTAAPVSTAPKGLTRANTLPAGANGIIGPEFQKYVLVSGAQIGGWQCGLLILS